MLLPAVPAVVVLQLLGTGNPSTCDGSAPLEPMGGSDCKQATVTYMRLLMTVVALTASKRHFVLQSTRLTIPLTGAVGVQEHLFSRYLPVMWLRTRMSYFLCGLASCQPVVQPAKYRCQAAANPGGGHICIKTIASTFAIGSQKLACDPMVFQLRCLLSVLLLQLERVKCTCKGSSCAHHLFGCLLVA